MSEPIPHPGDAGESPVLHAARGYLARGWRPIPIPRREKAPTRSKWQQLRLTEEDLPKYFPSGRENIGLLLGDPSGALVDVDLDAPEAVMAAPTFLPATGRRHGRPGKRDSHYWYVCDPTARGGKWQDVDQAMLCELRSGGQQTIVPPSIHPSGESLSWEEEGEPLRLPLDTLQAAVAKVAACALIARQWPGTGCRHEAALALAGFLLRGGLPVDVAVTVVETAARVAGDDEWRDRGEAVRSTARRVASGEPVTGAGTLAAMLRGGSAVLMLLRRWLGLRGDTHQDSSYYASGEGLVWRRPIQGGTVPVRLTNFCARIVGDLIEDDGVERRRLLEIEASVGDVSARITVPGAQFGTLAWVIDLLGPSAIVYAGISLREHTRAAIQELSGFPPRRTIYTHLGWRQESGTWMYLHAGGAIGGDGPVRTIEVRPPEALRRFVLPDPPTGADVVPAVRASLRLIGLGPDRLAIPLLAAVFRSALGPADFSLHLTGPTGTGKTELAALAQQHFGKDLGPRHLPGSWSSTGNALESLAFAAKDTLFVVDDFAPTGATSDIQRYHREADRLLRAQGNHAGRQRMRADATLRPPKAPRGLILSTGEDVPRGLSLQARLLVIGMSPTDLEWSRLSSCQADGACGRYAQTMAAFVQRLAPHFDEVLQRLRAEAEQFRQRAFKSEQHRRTASIVAELAVGWGLFLEFAQVTVAITVEERDQWLARGWQALGALATDQGHHQRDSNPAHLFLALLGGAVASGRAHVAGSDGKAPDIPEAWGWRAVTVGVGENEREEWRPGGDRVGWLDAHRLYLDPHAAFAAVQRFGRDGGELVPISLRTLTRRLKEQGLLLECEESRGVLTVRRMLEGKRRDVLALAPSSLASPESDQPDQGPPDGPPVPTAKPPSPGSPGAVMPDDATRCTRVVGLVGSVMDGDAPRATGHLSPAPANLDLIGRDAGRTALTAGIDSSGWPTELRGVGPRCPAGYTPCHICGEGTYVWYGTVAFCLPCALATYAATPAGNDGPKTPPEPSGSTSPDGHEDSHRPGPKRTRNESCPLRESVHAWAGS